jgi:hypothetical protein
MTTRRTAVAGLVAALLLGLSSAGTAAPDVTAESTPGKPFKRTELYFGSSKPDGSSVSPEEFDRFLDKEVTPAFPDGLTLLTGKGQWRDSSGQVVKERSYVLILLYPTTDQQANKEIEEIRVDYKRLYDQESVLRADSQDRVSF